jgi:hypothetical protein
VADVPSTVDNGGAMPPLSISVNGATVEIFLRCEKCQQRGMTLRSVPPVQARVFIRSLLKDGRGANLSEHVSVVCSECEKKGNINESENPE